MYDKKEKAIVVRDSSQCEMLDPSTRVYIGSEFCELQLPSLEEYDQFRKICEEKKINGTLLTPVCTEKGLQKCSALLQFAKKADFIDEIVVNDWGILHMLDHDTMSYKRILGRLLVSRYLMKEHCMYKQGENNIGSFPEAFVDFLKKNDLNRLEFNFVGHLRAAHEQLHANEIRAHLYVPYSYISVSRYCTAEFDYVRISNRIKESCSRECFTISAKRIQEKMCSDFVMHGNTLLTQAETPTGSDLLLIDRIVDNSASDIQRAFEEANSE